MFLLTRSLLPQFIVMHLNTSDELIEFNDLNVNIAADTSITMPGHGEERGSILRDPQPSTSTGRRGYSVATPQLATGPAPLTRSELMIKEAETSRARMLKTPGRNDSVQTNLEPVPMSFLHSAYVDKEYLVMGSHLDDATIKKIINHEFVIFSKLLPHDHLHLEDEQVQRMELINKNGMTFWSPVSNKDLNGGITSFSKWETAFRVFSNIYSTHYPLKAGELLQFSHVIHTASLTYHWENVYLYDREFRYHMSKHPQRSWSVILQQAWNLRLKDKLRYESHGGDHSKGKSKEICKRFNRGKCNLGASCKFDHRCLGCGKFGHGIHICRKCKSEGAETPVSKLGTEVVTTMPNK